MLYNCKVYCPRYSNSASHLENIASHRAQLLSSMLHRALSLGATELEPQFEPLKVIQSNAAASLDANAAF